MCIVLFHNKHQFGKVLFGYIHIGLVQDVEWKEGGGGGEGAR